MQARYVTLKTEQVQLVIDVAPGSSPSILYWGPALTRTSPEQLALLSMRQWVHGGTAEDRSPSLSNELGLGVSAAPGFLAHRNGCEWAILFLVREVQQSSANAVRVVCTDENTQLRATYELALDPDTHVLSASTLINNRCETPLVIDWCTALCMPLDPRLTQIMSLTGRWAMEFQPQPIAAFQGSFLKENKRGRTAHDGFPGLIVSTEHTSESSETAVGFHLAWSGNNRIRVDQHSDGRSFLQMGELFYPGELILNEGDSYATPTLYAAWSEQGLNGVSQRFHRHLTSKVMNQRVHRKPRPVHYNTWEAVYFDHSEEKLFALAEEAAALGVERFVLDDGWFAGRRNDRAGLGDWWVSSDVYPSGLGPLVKHVRQLGMEFGLWFEPEMVNPDSELFRTHPAWVLEAPGLEQVPSRNQYVLNLTLPEVSEYLFEKISALVSEHQIDYIKWDMNRDVHHPSSGGRAAIHRQTKAVYALMERLRRAHRELEIESCSSGGGRSDFGVLVYTDRLWTSDSNDALDRQRIQRGASLFFPLLVLGSHVGPAECHITQRRLSMNFRAATAVFGHMGLELDLLAESEDDLSVLQQAIELYKKHRHLLHGGDFLRLAAPDYLHFSGVVSEDTEEALFSCATLDSHRSTLPQRQCFKGLDATKSYRVKIIWPSAGISITTPSIIEEADLLEEGCVFSGEALLIHGLQLPLMHPASCLIFYLQAV
ncbi:MAG: alpha-galactosidase [Pseudomonadota bacterium]